MYRLWAAINLLKGGTGAITWYFEAASGQFAWYLEAASDQFAWLAASKGLFRMSDSIVKLDRPGRLTDRGGHKSG